MLGTHSPYLMLDAGRRARLFDRIAALIDERLSGTITKDYLAVLRGCITRSVVSNRTH